MDKELFGDDLERFEDEREERAEETERRMREEKKKLDRKSRQKKIAQKVEPISKFHNECNNPDSKSIEPMKPKEKLDKHFNSEGMRHHKKYLDFDPYF